MHTAICAFGDRERAEQAIASLQRAGFARHDLHLEYKHATSEGDPIAASDAPPTGASDRGALSSFGHFFVSLFGRDNPSGQADTYSQHVERGGYVVVVDADTEEQAHRARTLLQEMQGGDLNVVPRADDRRLRDILGRADEPAGLMERSRENYENWSPRKEMARERAMAANRLEAIGGSDRREPELDRPPGLRYADKNEPR